MKKYILFLLLMIPISSAHTATKTFQASSAYELPKPYSLIRVQVGLDSNLAGIDTKERVSTSILLGSFIIGPEVAESIVPQSYFYINPQLIANKNGPFYWWDGNSITKIGGMPLALAHSPYTLQSGTSQSLILNSAPTGGFNAGCSLCIFMEPSSVQQAAISARATAQSGGIPTADGVGLFEHPTNARFSLLLNVASYSTNSVVVSGTLTPAELSQIQPMMTIFTNSLVSGSNVTGPEDADYYMGIIKSISTTNNVTTIKVYGWGTQGEMSGGAIPSTTLLESYFWGSTSRPIIGIGGYNKSFSRNEFITYDGQYSGSANRPSTSLVRSFSGDEMDMIISNETRANTVKFVGYALNLAMSPDYTRVLTHDSIGFYAGGNTPHHFMAGDSCYIDGAGYYDQSAFESTAAWIGGACQLGALETTLGRYDQEVAEFDGRAVGSSDFRLMYHIAKGTDDGGTAATNIRPKLGVVLGGSHGSGVDRGSLQADLQWNWNANYGGLAICGNGTNCGFLINSSGVPHASPLGFSNGNGFIVGTQPLGNVAGLGLYATSDYTANLMEMLIGTKTEFKINAAGDVSAAGNVSAGFGGQIIIPALASTGVGVGNYLTTDGYARIAINALNGGTSGLIVGTVSASSYQETLTTPVSSSSTCKTGQFTDDANYHYVCVATNTWKRVALSSF